MRRLLFVGFNLSHFDILLGIAPQKLVGSVPSTQHYRLEIPSYHAILISQTKCNTVYSAVRDIRIKLFLACDPYVRRYRVTHVTFY